jgi:hypothetical protein
MKPSPELKARVLAAAARETSPDRRAVSGRVMRASVGAAAVCSTLFLTMGGVRAVERPIAFVLGTAAGWVGIATCATWASARRGKMVGRSLVLFLSAVVTPIALGIWYLAWVNGWGHGFGAPAPPSRAFVCLTLSLVLAVGPFAVLTLGRWATDPVHPRVAAAAIGVTAGAWAGVMMDLHCEHADLFHVMVGHVTPALVLAVVGALLGEQLLGVRAEPEEAETR